MNEQKSTCQHCGEESYWHLCNVCVRLPIDERIKQRGFPVSKDAPGYQYALDQLTKKGAIK